MHSTIMERNALFFLYRMLLQSRQCYIAHTKHTIVKIKEKLMYLLTLSSASRSNVIFANFQEDKRGQDQYFMTELGEIMLMLKERERERE